jgi:uncharacterized damage-inducible protein DinB
VVDLKPPRLVDGERATVQALLQYQRESLIRKVDGVTEESARHQFVGNATTLLWLLKHVARAETLWIVHRFAGEEIPPFDDSVNSTDTIAGAIEVYRATWRRVDEIISVASLDDLCRSVGDESAVNLRWVLMHLLEETARHAGHADIIRELLDGATGR